MYLDYCIDVDEAVSTLSEGREWIEAARVARRCKRNDLISTTVSYTNPSNPHPISTTLNPTSTLTPNPQGASPKENYVAASGLELSQ